jgi:Icc-related predicted phosphoesterase
VKILHLSDNHGALPELRDRDTVDVIVHSGDLMPNRSFGIREIEETFQRFWLEENGKRLKDWIGDKPFLYCPGNHDFVPAVPYLKDAGVDAYDLMDKLVEFGGLSFYGFPWTPKFYDWNYMCDDRELALRLQPAIELMSQGAIDVMVAHGPIFGVRDRNGEGHRCGSAIMRQAIQGARHPPRAFLHGHIHESAGLQFWSREVLVSNAATTQVILDLCTDTSSP